MGWGGEDRRGGTGIEVLRDQNEIGRGKVGDPELLSGDVNRRRGPSAEVPEDDSIRAAVPDLHPPSAPLEAWADPQSYLSVSTGSSRVARPAGTNDAAIPVAPKTVRITT